MMNRWLAPSLLLAIGATGCFYGDNHPPRGHSGSRPFSLPTCPSAVSQVQGVGIDTDAQMATEAGKGAGVLIEYANGGHWHIFTVCDTAISGFGCDFDITAQVIGGKVSNLLAEELETSDVATSYCADTAVLGVTTSNDFDGIWFDTTPGATVRITAALGQTLYAENFFWTSAGAVRSDASTNPVEFTPTAP